MITREEAIRLADKMWEVYESLTPEERERFDVLWMRDHPKERRSA